MKWNKIFSSIVKNYLIEYRMIHPDIVNTLMNKGSIREDKRNNAIYS